MSLNFCNTYWLLGKGADDEAKRWVAHEPHKEIIYSSLNAVEIAEQGNYLAPQLPIPPKGFLIVVVSHNDVDQMGLTLGVSHWGGDGGWIEPCEPVEDEPE